MSQALLVVDAQVNMFVPPWPVYDAETFLNRLLALLAYARATGMPVFFVQNNGGAGEPDVPGTPGWQLDPRLARQPDEPVVQKQSGNAFGGTNLADLLAAHNVDSVIICGFQSEWCINATVRGAVELGYPVTLGSDGHSTLDLETPALEQIETINAALGSIATLATADSILNP